MTEEEEELAKKLIEELVGKKVQEALKSEDVLKRIGESLMPSGQSLLRCPDGRCDYTTSSVQSYVEHRMKSFANVLADEFEKQLKQSVSEISQKIPTAETIKKVASSPECVDGVCNAVMKKLEEKEVVEREQQRRQRRSSLF